MNVTTEKKKLITERYSSSKKFFWLYWIKLNPKFILVSILGIAITSFMETWPAILIGDGLDELIDSGVTNQFYYYSIMIFVAAGIAWVAYFISAYLWTLAGFRFERDTRQEFFEVIHNHSMAFHDVNDSGVLLSMGMNEVAQMRMAYNPAIRQLVRNFFSLSITIYFLWQINTIIGAALLLSLIWYLALAWQYARRIGPVRRKLAKELGEVSSSSQEIFRGIDVVRSYANEEVEQKKFSRVSNNYAELIKTEGYLSSFYLPALVLVIFTAVAFGYSMLLMISSRHDFSAGDLTKVIALLLALNRFNFFIPRLLLMLQAGRINAERLWDVMTFDDPMVEPKESVDNSWTESIVFDNVSFNYPGTSKAVLKNVSFTIPPGSSVALLGGPGSGKTTVLKLLLRLYDPSEGEIRVNGLNMKDLQTKEVRKAITLVEQDIFLFSDTIKANIAFSKSTATDEEIHLAAKRAKAANFIEGMSEGYDTIIGERGVTLSGGQRQRLAIARALLSDPKVLLLDDFASAIDVKTEVQLRAGMDELIKGKTSIMVTHRLSTLAEADMIILMKKGIVVDIGTHKELLDTSEDYQFMCKYLPQKENGGN
ncbi:MAG: ABC transporter ATP-binding protein [Candidatus Kariarchaeaceae archaeon]